MPRSTSGLKDMSVKDITASFLAVLDNDEVITKLATALSVSINLALEERLAPLMKKLDGIIADNKVLHNRVDAVERENGQLKQINVGLEESLRNVNLKINQLEQTSRKNCLVISGVGETFAERVTEAGQEDAPPQHSREDTIKAVCSVLRESCKVEVSPQDIQSAFRLRSRRNEPRSILVSLHSNTLRASIMRARQPKQQLLFHGSPIFINDHLTKSNADLAFKARQLVKSKDAH